MYEHHPSQGGWTEIVAVGDYTTARPGISTILVKSGCSIETFKNPNFGGETKTCEAGANDVIYNEELHNLTWNDVTGSYKCECDRKLNLRVQIM